MPQNTSGKGGSWNQGWYGNQGGGGKAKVKTKPYSTCSCGNWAYNWRLRKQEGMCKCGNRILDVDDDCQQLDRSKANGQVGKEKGNELEALGDSIAKALRERGLDENVAKELTLTLQRTRPKPTIAPAVNKAYKDAQENHKSSQQALSKLQTAARLKSEAIKLLEAKLQGAGSDLAELQEKISGAETKVEQTAADLHELTKSLAPSVRESLEKRDEIASPKSMSGISTPHGRGSGRRYSCGWG